MLKMSVYNITLIFWSVFGWESFVRGLNIECRHVGLCCTGTSPYVRNAPNLTDFSLCPLIWNWIVCKREAMLTFGLKGRPPLKFSSPFRSGVNEKFLITANHCHYCKRFRSIYTMCLFCCKHTNKLHTSLEALQIF